MSRCEDLIPSNQSASSACDSIRWTDSLGVVIILVAVTGAVVELLATYMMRKQLRVHDSLPLMMMSMSAQALNVVAVLQLGANTETSCLLRPLVTNLTFTLACSSLAEHLVASRLHERGFTNWNASRNIFLCLVVDAVLQIAWIAWDTTPRLAPVSFAIHHASRALLCYGCAAELPACLPLRSATWSSQTAPVPSGRPARLVPTGNGAHAPCTSS